MLYLLIRRILWIAIFIVIGFIVKILRTKRTKKKIGMVILMLCGCCVCLAVIIFPVENIFFKAQSPEEILQYMTAKPPLGVAYGEQSCMAVYAERNSTYNNLIIPKKKDGYAIPSFDTSRRIYGAHLDTTVLSVYECEADYYILCMGAFPERSISVTDSLGSQFGVINANAGSEVDLELNTYLFYAYLESFADDYCITINGETFYVQN